MFRTEGIFQDISSSLLILYLGNKPTKGVCPPKLVVELGIATSGSQEGDKWHSRFVTLGVLSPVIFPLLGEPLPFGLVAVRGLKSAAKGSRNTSETCNLGWQFDE